jgi:hypothetical protein
MKCLPVKYGPIFVEVLHRVSLTHESEEEEEEEEEGAD